MEFIPFTEEQKQRANSVDLAEFLRRQGHALIRSGQEWRWKEHESLTIRDNTWYWHKNKIGGGPVQFVKLFMNLTYPEAVTLLLDGETAPIVCEKSKKEIVPFSLPPASATVSRVFAYLCKTRLLNRELIEQLVQDGLIYESREISKTGKEYHNAVFVGKDETGIPRHAHKRSLNSVGKGYRGTVPGSDYQYSFHLIGPGDTLYLFEAPIDLLSYLTLFSTQNWREQSYAAQCGVWEHVLLWILENNPQIQTVCLCEDHDPAGIESRFRIGEILRDRGGIKTKWLFPEHKDWNEDLKAANGLEAIPAANHPLVASCFRLRQTLLDGPACSPEAFIQLSRTLCLVSSLEQWKQERTIHMLRAFAVQAGALAMREAEASGLVQDTAFPNSLASRCAPHQNQTGIQERQRKLLALCQETQTLLSKEARTSEESRLLIQNCQTLCLGSIRMEAYLREHFPAPVPLPAETPMRMTS